jgi:uncharacterized protein
MRLEQFFQRIGYVTLKLTRGCNLHCSYCNVEALTPRTPKMSLDRFRQVAHLLLENSRQSNVGLEFHGGEPLLQPDEWFEEAVAYGRELAARNNKHVTFPLTTNGTLLTEERLLRLHKLGIQFCMSVDGPPDINDLVRGGGAAVERAVRLFQQHKIPLGVLTVMSRGNYHRMGRVMQWFQQVGIDDYRVNFLQPQGRGDDAQLLTGEEMFEGMRQILDHMDQTGSAVSEAETEMTLTKFVHGRNPHPHFSCWEFQCQAGRNYVAIDHEGVIHACGTDMSHHPLGNLDSDLDEKHYEATLLRLHDKGDWVIRCFDCDARRICRHSCSTSDYNSETYKEHECHYTKFMYKHLCEHPDKALRIKAAQLARHGPPPGSSFVPASQLQILPQARATSAS